jgi:hypothetical protein
MTLLRSVPGASALAPAATSAPVAARDTAWSDEPWASGQRKRYLATLQPEASRHPEPLAA